ncbi:hypothetical protein AU14_15805 [Marinobacter similis]|uniref:Uncharacterized protein n=1 Tax=Marinobacter similis TaxID=1420916 RepID=W5YM98_9GAMM|nr:hypothetical protein AU14_15805 [Marinobacter similis]
MAYFTTAPLLNALVELKRCVGNRRGVGEVDAAIIEFAGKLAELEPTTEAPTCRTMRTEA